MIESYCINQKYHAFPLVCNGIYNFFIHRILCLKFISHPKNPAFPAAVGSCAHVRELQRTKHGPFTLSDALPEDKWNAEQIMQSVTRFRNIIDKYYREYKMATFKDKW